MRFVNPFDLLDLDTSEVPSSAAIRKAKRRALLKFDLADDNAVKINGQAVQRSDFLSATEELSDEQKREFYFALHTQEPALNRFLLDGTLEFFLDFSRGHQNKGLYKFAAFVTFVSPHFARQYGRLLKSALQEGDLSLLERLTARDPLVTEQDTSTLYKKAGQHIRHLQEEIEAIQEQVRQKKETSPQRIEAQVKDRVDTDLLNALPAYLEGRRSQLASALRGLSVVVFNELDDAEEALALIRRAAALRTSASTASRLQKSLDEIKDIYEERRLADEHSDALEACADAIGQLAQLDEAAEARSADPEKLRKKAENAADVEVLNGLPEAFEEICNQTALGLRNLALTLWNTRSTHQSARAAVALTELALRLDTGPSVQAQLRDDLNTLEDLARQTKEDERRQVQELADYVGDIRSKIDTDPVTDLLSGRSINWPAVEEAIDSVFTAECVEFLKQADESETKRQLLTDLFFVTAMMRGKGGNAQVLDRLMPLFASADREFDTSQLSGLTSSSSSSSSRSRSSKKSDRSREQRSNKDRPAKRKERKKQGAASSEKSGSSSDARASSESDGAGAVVGWVIFLFFVFFVVVLASSESDSSTNAMATAEPEPVALSDTMHFEVVAAAGPVKELRVTADDSVRRPYWIETGDSKSFAATDKIVFGPPVLDTGEQPMDAITLKLNGRSYPTDQRNADGEVVITRDSARAFLKGRPASEESVSETATDVGGAAEASRGVSSESTFQAEQEQPSQSSLAAAVEASPYEDNHLENGASPYDDYFGQGHYSSRDNNKVVFENGQSFDAVICLVDIYSGQTIRNEYIRAGTQFEMTSIPDGTYYLKTFYGRDWNPNKRILGGRIAGGFETNFYFDKSENDRLRMRDDGYQYSIYEVTLYAVAGGNMTSQNINASEFFN